MPLFGSKHKHDNATAADTTTGGGRHHQMQSDVHNIPSNNGVENMNTYGAGNQPTSTMHPGGATGPTNTFVPNTNTYGQQPGGQAFGQDDPYTAGGVGHQGIGHQGGGRGIPPTGAVNHNQNNSGGAGQRMTGKIESAVGTMVGSNALKAKGLQKEQEANSVKLQGRELAEAERLEREALMRRERAVGHGAHPANSALGAGHIGTTGQGGMSGGSGPGYTN